MATVVVYQHAIGDLFGEAFDADSTTVAIALVSQGYTPSYSSHSSFTADISTYQVTTSGYAQRNLQGVTFSKVSDSYWVFDADDITISASGVMGFKYVVGILQASGRPVFYMDIDTSTTSAEMNAREILIRWNSDPTKGIFNLNNQGLASWQLASGHYVSSLLAPTIVYPRPDSETNTYAYHRKLSSHLPYRVDVGVRHGSYPLHYSLSKAPTGATIGSFLSYDTSSGTWLDNDTYGQVQWDSPSSGSHTFTVEVTDQEGRTASVTWVSVLEESAFAWVDSVNGDDGTGDGTFANPFKTFEVGLWASSNSVTAFPTTIAVFRDGNYYANGDGLAGLSSAKFDAAYKPMALVGYPGESANFSCSAGYFSDYGTGGDANDLLMQNLAIENDKSTLDANTKVIGIFGAGNVSSRVTFNRLAFRNMTYGSTGNDNPGCIVFTGLTHPDVHQYVSVRRCTVDNCTMQLFAEFDTWDIIVEHNQATNCNFQLNGGYFLQFKDRCTRGTMRANIAVDTIQATETIFIGGNDTDNDYIEVCYNKVVRSNTSSGSTILWNGLTGGSTAHEHSYRNSIINTYNNNSAFCVRVYDNATHTVVAFENDAWGRTGANYFHANDTSFIQQTNIAQILASDFDANGNLSGTARATYLGTHGAEIA